MSIGVGGFAVLELQDEETMLYSYGGFNLNIPKYRNLEKIRDGCILIARDALPEPEIRRKRTRRPNGRKLVVEKRVYAEPSLQELIRTGKISVSNCTNCWKQDKNGVDLTAIYLIASFFRSFQTGEKIPDKLVFYK